MTDFSGLDDQGNRPDGITSGPGSAAASERETLVTLAESDPEGCAERLLKEWDASNKHVKNLKEQWKVNRARSKGYTGLTLIKTQDENRAYIPPGAKQSVAGMNKAARLKRRLRAQMFADPAKPEATPSSDEDNDRDAAELSTRVLEDICSEGNLDLNLRMGDSFDLASDYGSGFIHFFVDPSGGGSQPREIEATPWATSEADAIAPDPSGMQPLVITTRYLREDGTITDNVAEAARIWLPKLRNEILTGRNCRFVPYTASDLWDAEGFMIGALVPWAVVRGMFPQVDDLGEDKIAKILEHRPEQANDLLPAGKKDRQEGNRDEQLCFVLTRYQRQAPPDYPRGHWFIVLGGGHLADHGDLYDEDADEPMDIPVTQVGQYHEEGNPYKQALMELLGPGNEVRALMLGAFLEHLDKFLNRRIFLPLNSILKPEQLQMETGGTLPINPGGEPKYEELPNFPAVAEKMYAMTTADLDDESGLQEPAQGMNPPSVTSGKQVTQLIEQTVVGLSELRDNLVRAYVRAWRIILQQVRAHYAVQQKVRYVGDGGAFKVKTWSGADLGTTKDVRLQRGTFTQLSPIHKANLALTYFSVADEQGNRVLDLGDVKHLLTGEVGGWIGLRDDPHRNRVRRQISEFNEGPPEDWAPPEPVAQANPQTGQMQVMQPPDPVVNGIFTPLPVDAEPGVARVRAEELGRALAGARYRRFPKEWQQGLVAAYETARKAAGVVTVAEQQQAQQAAAQAQQQAQAQQVQTEQQGQQLDAQTKIETAKIGAQAKIQGQQIEQAGDVEAERLRTVAAMMSTGVRP